MLKDTIPDEEMRHPTGVDQNDEPCLMVIKRGMTTGLTVGRANNIYSYARYFYHNEEPKTSKEWAIFGFDSKSGAFSDRGDSGSVIVDGLGRVGGLLTGGAGVTPSSDVTYATPISFKSSTLPYIRLRRNFLLKRMYDNGLRKPNVYPVLTT
jgi:hypothetical protein